MAEGWIRGVLQIHRLESRSLSTPSTAQTNRSCGPLTIRFYFAGWASPGDGACAPRAAPGALAATSF